MALLFLNLVGLSAAVFAMLEGAARGVDELAKRRSHPCYLGDGEYDHYWMAMDDEQGDGIMTMTYRWVECRNCGEPSPNGADDLPEYDPADYGDVYFDDLNA